MQVIIPMTGNGTRFKNAGYKTLKPFIKIHNKPIIEWIISMFDCNDSFIFICRDIHLKQNPDMYDFLKKLSNNTVVFETKEWDKEGPVVDILKAESLIQDNIPVIVNYCDFYMQWNYDNFKNYVLKNKFDGAIPCYTGFHPNLIPIKNLYASCKVDKYMHLKEIKEKHTYEANKYHGYHSVGTYYFKSGQLMKKYYKKQIEQRLSTNNEYYSSMTYNILIQDGYKVGVYDKVNRFCQWGTPYDLEEYLYYTNIANQITEDL